MRFSEKQELFSDFMNYSAQGDLSSVVAKVNNQIYMKAKSIEKRRLYLRFSILVYTSTINFSARGSLLKLILSWVPSQKGLLSELPQRHKEISPLVANVFPFASIMSIDPFICKGPLSCT